MGKEKFVFPKFIGKPDPQIRVDEGITILLRCQVEKPKNYINSWFKVDKLSRPDFIFESPNMTRGPAWTDRFVFVGDRSQGDYSMEIKSTTVKDTGQYVCHVRPIEGSDHSNMNDYMVKTNITVLPQQLQPINGEGNNSHQQAHSLTALASSDLTTDGGDPSHELMLPNDKTKHQYHENGLITSRNAQSQLYARGIPPGWAKLSSSPSSSISSSSSSLSSSPSMQPSAFINSHPSHHSGINYPAMRASTGPNGLSGSATASLALLWPYLFIVLAFILMMANIFLVYSLIRRYKSCSSSSTGSSAADLEEQTTTSSNNSSSGASSSNNNNNNYYPYPPHHHTNSILKKPRIS